MKEPRSLCLDFNTNVSFIAILGKGFDMGMEEITDF